MAHLNSFTFNHPSIHTFYQRNWCLAVETAKLPMELKVLTNDLECTSQAARRAHPLLRSGLALALGRHSEREGFRRWFRTSAKPGPNVRD